MPKGDGTGPTGIGPMTGRGAGYCAGFSTPWFANPVPRMGMAFRRGAGSYGGGGGFGQGKGRDGGYAGLTSGLRNPPQAGLRRVGSRISPQPTKEQEVGMLEDRLAFLEDQVKRVTDRIEQLRGQSDSNNGKIEEQI